MTIDFPAPFAQIPDQFFTCFQLTPGGLVTIEIAHQTNTERDVVQIIAMHVTTVDLASPAVADLDFAISGGRSVADNKMIGQTVLHPPNVAVVVVEDARVPLTSSAVVDNNELPSTTHYRGAINLRPDGSG